MDKLLIFLGLTVGSYFGYWLGAPYGMMTSVILGAVFSVLGIYLGWRMGG